MVSNQQQIGQTRTEQQRGCREIQPSQGGRAALASCQQGEHGVAAQTFERHIRALCCNPDGQRARKPDLIQTY